MENMSFSPLTNIHTKFTIAQNWVQDDKDSVWIPIKFDALAVYILPHFFPWIIIHHEFNDFYCMKQTFVGWTRTKNACEFQVFAMVMIMRT